MFEVGETRSINGGVLQAELNFSRGGFQGGEGVTGGEAWYIENVLEELDSAREWYFDAVSHTLYYAPNATADGGVTSTAESTPPRTGFVGTGLAVLINVSGSQAQPARGIVIDGITLRDASATYLAPHGLPSGGDWALQKQGAITLVGTEDVAIRNSLFTELDGNAVFIGGYHRGLRIESNEFYGIGDSVSSGVRTHAQCLLRPRCLTDGWSRSCGRRSSLHRCSPRGGTRASASTRIAPSLCPKESRWGQTVVAATNRAARSSVATWPVRLVSGRSRAASGSRLFRRRRPSRATCSSTAHGPPSTLYPHGSSNLSGLARRC
jgi:hypothetical protein